MRSTKLALLTAFTFAFLGLGAAPGTTAHAQISVTLGAAPDCPYGYYDYAPYNCAPYGYYGPEWFNNGVFIGAGKWYHGSSDFHGQVNNHYDVRNGYHGQLPARGSHPAQPQHTQAFHGNETHDTQGHVVSRGGGNDHGGGH